MVDNEHVEISQRSVVSHPASRPQWPDDGRAPGLHGAQGAGAAVTGQLLQADVEQSDSHTDDVPQDTQPASPVTMKQATRAD